VRTGPGPYSVICADCAAGIAPEAGDLHLMAGKETFKIESLQYLRAIAAANVVLCHLSATLTGRQGARLLFDGGRYGVDLFFVISGFVMLYTTAGRSTLPGQFFLKRCVRIVPIYFILTTVAFLSLHFWAKQSILHSVSPGDYLRSILFIPYLTLTTQEIQPVLRQGWTLNYEMFFYLVFACILWLKEKHRVWACIGVFATLTAIGIWVSPTGVLAKTYTDPIMLEFIFGVVIAYFLLVHTDRFLILVCALLAASVVALTLALWLGIYPRVLFAGIPAAAVVAGAIWLERRGWVPNWPLFLLVGDASYSLYLLHTFVLSGLKLLFLRIFDVNQTISQLMFMLVGLISAIVAAVLFYKAVELPITKYLQALTKPLTQSRERRVAVTSTAP